MVFSGHLVNNILSQIRGAKDIVASLVSHFGSVVTTCSGDQSGPIRAMFLASKMAARAFSRYCKAQCFDHTSLTDESIGARSPDTHNRAQWIRSEMILPDPKSEKIGFGFGLVSDRICTSLIRSLITIFQIFEMCLLLTHTFPYCVRQSCFFNLHILSFSYPFLILFSCVTYNS